MDSEDVSFPLGRGSRARPVPARLQCSGALDGSGGNKVRHLCPDQGQGRRSGQGLTWNFCFTTIKRLAGPFRRGRQATNLRHAQILVPEPYEPRKRHQGWQSLKWAWL